MSGNDWVEVSLSRAGERYLKENGGGQLLVHEGQHEFRFDSGVTQRVTRAFDWERVLKNVHVGGLALLEIATEPASEVLERSTAAGAEVGDQE